MNSFDRSLILPSTINLRWAMFIVFLINYCLLVLELVAARLMAPIVGVSLYTWTSVIGVVLSGVGLGSFIGGKLADRWNSNELLSVTCVLSGLSCASILGLLEIIEPLNKLEIPFPMSVLLIFFIVFFVPTTLLGTISPIVLKLVLTNLNSSGDIAGKIYTAGALGGIAGTFSTGYVLISTFGTRFIIWGIASGLILLGAIISLIGNNRYRLLTMIFYLVFLASFRFTQVQALISSQCFKETNYYCIQVIPDNRSQGRYLFILDRLIHSHINLNDPSDLNHQYQRVFAEVLQRSFIKESNPSVLLVGGGGYSFARYIRVTYPNSHISVIEIDPGVTETVFTLFDQSLETNINSYNGDARQIINLLPSAQKYDLIVNDAASDISFPFHLATLEFNQMISERLTEKGLYMSNLIDGSENAFLHAYLRTIRQVFSQVYLSTTGGEIGESKRHTYVVVATNSDLKVPLKDPTTSYYLNDFLSDAALIEFLENRESITLTDDYVPIDNLLAPVFMDSAWE